MCRPTAEEYLLGYKLISIDTTVLIMINKIKWYVVVNI